MSGGEHGLVLLDAPAPKADQLREAWMAGQGAGYEVAVVQPLSSDPEVCGREGALWVCMRGTGYDCVSCLQAGMRALLSAWENVLMVVWWCGHVVVHE